MRLTAPFLSVLGLLLSVVPGLALAQTPPKAGPEFQVNAYTTDYQIDPAIGVEPDGDFVIAWTSDGPPGDDSSRYGIRGQRFTSSGLERGGPFQINTYTPNDQFRPAIGVEADGDFVVVWASGESPDNDDSGDSIQGQRFGSDGLERGEQFEVNTYTTDNQYQPVAGTASDGNFVVAWTSESADDDTSSLSIQGQRFSSAGLAVGVQFQINTYTSSNENEPDLGVEPDGDFVVVWTGSGSEGVANTGSSIQGQRFASDGFERGIEFRVNSYTTDNQSEPALAMEPGGGFVVAWTSYGSYGDDSSYTSILGQRFGSNGLARAAEFQINRYTSGRQSQADIGVEPDGDFVVVWRSLGSVGDDSSSYTLQGQRFGSDGLAQGEQFQVNSYTTDLQYLPALGVQSDGDFVVVWSSYGSAGSDSSGYSIQGQRYRDDIFADGFESGEVCLWSTAAGAAPCERDTENHKAQG